MAIDISDKADELLTFPQAAKLLPGRDGGRIAPSTVWRWATRGCQGPNGTTVRLETVRVGGLVFTSAKAVREFIAALTGATRPADPPQPAKEIRTPMARKRSSERAARKLAAAGI